MVHFIDDNLMKSYKNIWKMVMFVGLKIRFEYLHGNWTMETLQAPVIFSPSKCKIENYWKRNPASKLLKIALSIVRRLWIVENCTGRIVMWKPFPYNWQPFRLVSLFREKFYFSSKVYIQKILIFLLNQFLCRRLNISIFLYNNNDWKRNVRNEMK